MPKTTKQNKTRSAKSYTLDKKREDILKSLTTKSNSYWMNERTKNMLDVFHRAAKDVPAYKDFLKKNKVNPSKIKTLKDFEDNVPIINKENYIKKYSIEKLCWNGTLKKPLVFTSTSGSTGESTYFTRTKKLDEEYSFIIESFLKNSSYNSSGPVLVIIGFGMGIWIGGLITYKAFEIAADRSNLPVSIITPGINKLEIFKALKKLSPHYQETIIVGYPPFLKDIIDESSKHNINLNKLNIRLFSAAESYTEGFREYIAKKAGVKDVQRDITNIYGSADIGAMAWETPTSILIRRLAVHNKKLFQGLFSNTEKTPTLAQYNPLFVNFESTETGNILLTGDSAIPLVRYSIGDKGGIVSFNGINSKFASFGVSLYKEAKKIGIEKDLYQLPFVYVYERDDFSASVYGLKIYPEPIREALIRSPICDYLTGKFTLETYFNKKHDQHFSINFEVRRNEKITKMRKEKVLKSVVEVLEKNNSEYRELHKFLGKRALPKIVFWDQEDPKYFKPGIKQKWVK